MRVLVCGGRDFVDQQAVDDGLDVILCGPFSRASDVIIQGGAKGADTCALRWANSRAIEWITYPADWYLYGKKAGYIRNKQMLVEGQPDLVVAFPGGKGTAMMMDLARKVGVKAIEMGAKGSQTMTPAGLKFKTDRYERIYIDRMSELRGFATPGQRYGILRDLILEEANWIANMGTEYDEIMQAQEMMDSSDGNATDYHK